MNWRVWLGGVAITALVLLGIGFGLRLPLLFAGGKGLAVLLIGVLLLSALLPRSRPKDPQR